MLLVQLTDASDDTKRELPEIIRALANQLEQAA